MYNLNYAPTTLGVQSWREIICGGTRTKKVEYRWSRPPILNIFVLPEHIRYSYIFFRGTLELE
jgi:hypothetical protein